MAYCEDYPCCGHTDQDPCERQWYDEPGAFDLRVNPHAFCEHEVGICNVPDELTECPEGCTGVEIEDEGESSGFSGGTIYWVTYSCGHQEVDASGDTLSAVDDFPSGTPDSWIPDNPNEDGFTRADFI